MPRRRKRNPKNGRYIHHHKGQPPAPRSILSDPVTREEAKRREDGRAVLEGLFTLALLSKWKPSQSRRR
jgi:hypothetical protein